MEWGAGLTSPTLNLSEYIEMGKNQQVVDPLDSLLGFCISNNRKSGEFRLWYR